MIDGEPAAAPPPMHLLGDGNMDEVMSAPMAGYFRPHVELLQEVESGQLVGAVHDPLGVLLAELHAEKDGIVIMRRGVHRVHSGDGSSTLPTAPNDPNHRLPNTAVTNPTRTHPPRVRSPHKSPFSGSP